jgi:HEAT repeat protein
MGSVQYCCSGHALRGAYASAWAAEQCVEADEQRGARMDAARSLTQCSADDASDTRSDVATIYVALLDEAVEVWRPVQAAHEGGDRYRILSANADPEDEQWEFQQGELVRCRVKTFSGGGSGWVAFEKA